MPKLVEIKPRKKRVLNFGNLAFISPLDCGVALYLSSWISGNPLSQRSFQTTYLIVEIASHVLKILMFCLKRGMALPTLLNLHVTWRCLVLSLDAICKMEFGQEDGNEYLKYICNHNDTNTYIKFASL